MGGKGRIVLLVSACLVGGLAFAAITPGNDPFDNYLLRSLAVASALAAVCLAVWKPKKS